jgi:hypothetical protein
VIRNVFHVAYVLGTYATNIIWNKLHHETGRTDFVLPIYWHFLVSLLVYLVNVHIEDRNRLKAGSRISYSQTLLTVSEKNGDFWGNRGLVQERWCGCKKEIVRDRRRRWRRRLLSPRLWLKSGLMGKCYMRRVESQCIPWFYRKRYEGSSTSVWATIDLFKTWHSHTSRTKTWTFNSSSAVTYWTSTVALSFIFLVTLISVSTTWT